MSRGVIVALLLFSSVAAAQVVHVPPPQRRVIGYWDNVYIDPHALAILQSLNRPRCQIVIQVGSEGQVKVCPGDAFSGPGALLSNTPEELGLDPTTGQPLYWRKGDGQPAEPPASAPATAPADPAVTPPRPAPDPAGVPAKGQVVILPYRPRVHNAPGR